MQPLPINEIAPGVFACFNFLSAQELAKSLASIRECAVWEKAPLGEYVDNQVVTSFVNLTLRDVDVANGAGLDLLPIQKKESGIESFINDRGFRITQFSRKMISRYTSGCHIRSHRDTGVYDTFRMFTLICYLDEEYSGGEIFFPALSLSHRPRAGELLFFYSEHEHGVSPVISGTRHCVVWFAENLGIQKRI